MISLSLFNYLLYFFLFVPPFQGNFPSSMPSLCALSPLPSAAAAFCHSCVKHRLRVLSISPSICRPAPAQVAPGVASASVPWFGVCFVCSACVYVCCVLHLRCRTSAHAVPRLDQWSEKQAQLQLQLWMWMSCLTERTLRVAGQFHKVFYLMENLSIVENGVN